MLGQQSIEIQILREIKFSNAESVKIATFSTILLLVGTFADYRVPRGSNPRP